MDHFWKHCLKQFSARFDESSFSAFIQPTVTRTEGDLFLIVSPNSTVDRWLKKNLEPSFKEFFESAYPTKNYRFVVEKKASHAKQAAPSPSPVRPVNKEKTAVESGLKEDLCFDFFVPGQANELPLQLAKGMSQGDLQINPLFIYGSTGLGKTHLAHAIGNQYLSHFPDRRVLCITARNFLSEFVAACRNQQVEQFKDKYKRLDMLIVDDIQYIGGDKERTQEEFFYLFNFMQENDKQIVITCDRAPKQIKDMHSRLTSRFNSGCATYLPAPEFELRVAIVRHLSERWKTVIDDEVTHFIAENIRSNVRELKGAVKRIFAMCRYQDTGPSVALCRKALSDLIGRTNVIISIDIIKEKVCKYYGIRFNDLTSQKRNQAIAHPRHIAIYLCRQLTNLSLPDIGKKFGNRNHTTVLHSCRLTKENIKNNNELREQIQYLEMLIKEACH